VTLPPREARRYCQTCGVWVLSLVPGERPGELAVVFRAAATKLYHTRRG
jgi:hypothetical protein